MKVKEMENNLSSMNCSISYNKHSICFFSACCIFTNSS